MERYPLRKPVIVEGRYDKIKLDSLFVGEIIPTDGFRIFKEPGRLALIRSLAAKTGIIVLTDSDQAGFKIRSYLASAIPRDQITHLYIPDIAGKEKRKTHPSAEGTLGVEGVPAQVILEAFREAGELDGPAPRPSRPITKLDLYEAGLSGGEGSRALRGALLARLDLPARLGANALVGVLNRLLDYDQFCRLLEELRQPDAAKENAP